MMSAIETAVPYTFTDDLEEPLIPHFEPGNNSVEDKESEVTIDDEAIQAVHHYFQMLGWTLGFLLQCVSLGATASMALFYSAVPTSEENMVYQFLYWTLFGLSNSWFLLFPLVCLAIERSWKVSGICFIQKYVMLIEEPIVTAQTKRMSFVASVRFLIGIVLGCFMTWGLIDLYLNASYSMLLTLFASMMACLSLCHGMIFIYDSFKS